jgi:ubiquinone/menaquinone biosynthesis C-methylase UbiE
MGQDGSYAAFYGDRGHETHDFYARKDRVEEFLVGHLRPGQSVLDVGCGTGPMVDFFCSKELRYCGLDVAQGMLDSISRQFSNTPYWKRIELKIGSSESIPYPDNSFDFFVGMGLLEYLDDMAPTFKEIARVVKPQGVAVLTIPNLISLNRFLMRNTGFITALYRSWKKLMGVEQKARREIVHKELAPGALDAAMKHVGFECVGKAFYDYKLICYPITRLLPQFAYAINRRIENRAPSFLANSYIGFYQKQK